MTRLGDNLQNVTSFAPGRKEKNLFRAGRSLSIIFAFLELRLPSTAAFCGMGPQNTCRGLPQRRGRVLSILLCLAIQFCLVDVSRVFGQSDLEKSLMFFQMEILVAQPASFQAGPTPQAVFRKWFIERVRDYQNVFADTFIGKSGEKIVFFGDFSKFFERFLSPPCDRNRYLILFENIGTPQVPEKGRKRILFPRSQCLECIGGLSRFNTCWHEFQHLIFIAAEKQGWKPKLNVKDWTRYLKPPGDGFPEHVYIESFAEYTLEWLDVLLHERAIHTGGAGMGFERKVIEAWDRVRKFRATGKEMSFFDEHYIWAEAHDAWVRAWPLARKIAPLPPDLRNEYADLTGIRIGSVEEITNFFVHGGIEGPEGEGIPVPRWVTRAEPFRSPIVSVLNRISRKEGDGVHFQFDFRILENFRFKEKNSVQVRKGELSIATKGLFEKTNVRPAKTSPSGQFAGCGAPGTPPSLVVRLLRGSYENKDKPPDVLFESFSGNSFCYDLSRCGKRDYFRLEAFIPGLRGFSISQNPEVFLHYSSRIGLLNPRDKFRKNGDFVHFYGAGAAIPLDF